MMYRYLATISLSLYIFNLFALPFLDGSQFLSATLDFIGGSGDRDDDDDVGMNLDIEAGTRMHLSRNRNRGSLATLGHSISVIRIRVRRRKSFIERTVKFSTASLMVVAASGMVWVGSW